MKQVSMPVLFFSCLAVIALVSILGGPGSAWAAQDGSIRLRSVGGFVASYTITWTEKKNGADFPGVFASGNVTSAWVRTVTIPGNARNIHVNGSIQTGLAWQPTRVVLDKILPTPPIPEKCYEVYGTTLNAAWKEC